MHHQGRAVAVPAVSAFCAGQIQRWSLVLALQLQDTQVIAVRKLYSFSAI